jgi:hypothetical protein
MVHQQFSAVMNHSQRLAFTGSKFRPAKERSKWPQNTIWVEISANKLHENEQWNEARKTSMLGHGIGHISTNQNVGGASIWI